MSPPKEGQVVTVHPPRSVFMDSGAHSLWRFKKTAEEYRVYMDRYAAFLKENEHAIDVYANVDVIPDPKRSWEHQKYLENEHGLSPVPVVHHGNDVRHLARYLDAGYTYVGLGSPAEDAPSSKSTWWFDECFDLICKTPDRTPAVKVHGFAVGGHELITRFPWYSVDTTRWVHLGVRGYIQVPVKNKGQFDPTQPCLGLRMGSSALNHRHHIKLPGGMSPGVRELVREWCAYRGKRGELPTLEGVEEGLTEASKESFLKYYEWLRRGIRKYPWPFTFSGREGFAAAGSSVDHGYESSGDKRTYLKIYYSGTGSMTSGRPEVYLGGAANVMPTFFDIPNKVWTNIAGARASGAPVEVTLKKGRRKCKTTSAD